MVTKITPKHLEDYASQYYDFEHLSQLKDDFLFETICETIVEQNEEYTVERLAEEWSDASGDITISEFVATKFEEVLGEESKNYVTLSHKDLWVESTVQGIHEVSS